MGEWMIATIFHLSWGTPWRILDQKKLRRRHACLSENRQSPWRNPSLVIRSSWVEIGSAAATFRFSEACFHRIKRLLARDSTGRSGVPIFFPRSLSAGARNPCPPQALADLWRENRRQRDRV